jgi:hypothetical protein
VAIYVATVKMEGLPSSCNECRLCRFVSSKKSYSPNGARHLIRVECAIDCHLLNGFGVKRSDKCKLRLQEEEGSA